MANQDFSSPLLVCKKTGFFADAQNDNLVTFRTTRKTRSFTAFRMTTRSFADAQDDTRALLRTTEVCLG